MIVGHRNEERTLDIIDKTLSAHSFVCVCFGQHSAISQSVFDNKVRTVTSVEDECD